MKKALLFRVNQETEEIFNQFKIQNKLETNEQVLQYLLQLATESLPEEKKTHEPIRCPFFAWSINGYVECGRWLSKKGKTIKLGYEACRACHERRTFIQTKKEEQVEDEFGKAYGKDTPLYRLSQLMSKEGKIYTGNIESYGRPKWRLN